MNLGRMRRIARPVLSLNNEYRLRSLTSSVLPHEQPTIRRAYHFCNWKTGSPRVRLILSDPRLHARTGLPVPPHHNRLGRPPTLIPGPYPTPQPLIPPPPIARPQRPAAPVVGASAGAAPGWARLRGVVGFHRRATSPWGSQDARSRRSVKWCSHRAELLARILSDAMFSRE